MYVDGEILYYTDYPYDGGQFIVHKHDYLPKWVNCDRLFAGLLGHNLLGTHL